ncbi:M20/M25/M40 family metallo-hydrolase [Microcella sp.]|uniref:M20/M25/M40 family metallo-hydrolase n=1 Tax=Microcella sp. TaxID=1913979 RepID=UPI003F6EFFDA
MSDSAPMRDADADARAIERLRALVRIPTISRPTSGPGPRTDVEPFARFTAALDELYPRVHERLEVERVGARGLLYRWPGSDPSGASRPTVLMAHSDVVPATDEGWQHPSFAGEVVEHDGEPVVWGRGAIDDKGALVAQLEAVDRLLAAGFTPRHDVLLSFGGDEEVAGDDARAAVALLRERGIRPALVLDEGGAIVQDSFPGLDEPFALVGVTEKGITTLRLRVEQQGGHASSPPPFAATERLARAILRLNAAPARARLDPVMRRMIRTLGARARQPLRFVFTRVDLFAPLIVRALLRRGAEITALLRTTRAVTELRAGHAANALPEHAEATVNIRIAPWSSVAEAVDEVRRGIDDELVAIDVLQPSEPSPVSPADGVAWNDLVAALQETHPGLLVSPYVMMQASDSRFFTAISEHVYRFTPFRLSAAERACLHARDERIRVSAFLDGVATYEALLRRR